MKMSSEDELTETPASKLQVSNWLSEIGHWCVIGTCNWSENCPDCCSLCQAPETQQDGDLLSLKTHASISDQNHQIAV